MKCNVRSLSLHLAAILLIAGCRTPESRAPSQTHAVTGDILDGFLALGSWSVDLSLGSPAALKTDDNKAQISFNIKAAAPKDKCVIKAPVRMSMGRVADVSLDAENLATGPCRLAFAVEMYNGDYYESKSVSLKPGMNPNIDFRLSDRTYKCAATGWRHEAKPSNLEAARSICLLVYTKGRGAVVFRNFRMTASRGPASHTGEWLFPAAKGDKWGHVDISGYMVVRPRFDRTFKFAMGLAAVLVDGKYGYIDINGKTVIPTTFDEAKQFSEGLACVRVGTQWGYIKQSGKYVVRPQFDSASSFKSGLAHISVAHRYGFIDLRGRVVIPLRFEKASHFAGGLARVMIGHKWGFITMAGKVVIPATFTAAGDFSRGLAPVKFDTQWGYINRRGKTVIEPSFSLAREFSCGLAPVAVKEKWGCIDNTGQFKIIPQFQLIEGFSEGLSPVLVGGKWGYIDLNGETAIKPMFSLALPHTSGAAFVQLTSKLGDVLSTYIDTTGRYLVRPSKWESPRSKSNKASAGATRARR